LLAESNNVRGGYCRVEDGKLIFWWPSTFPVNAAKEEEFHQAVNERNIQIIDL